MFQPQYRNNAVLMIPSSSMYRYSSWLVYDYEPRVRIVMNDLDRTRGNGRFMTVYSMRNTISVLNFVRLIDDFAVYCHRSTGDCRAIVFRLSVAEFRAKYFEEALVMPSFFSPRVICLCQPCHLEKVHSNMEVLVYMDHRKSSLLSERAPR